MNKFYYKIEPYKGYIVGDKLHINGEPYEISWWNKIIGEDIQKEYEKENRLNGAAQAFNIVKDKINANITEFLNIHKQENEKIKPFYLNFNYDGIDCFCHRWNWKD